MIVPAVFGASGAVELQWRNLPDLPKGLGGQFVGVASHMLIVAGGSYFDTPPWSGGQKIRVDTVYGLAPDAPAWRLLGKLPHQVTSGAAVSTPEGMLCTGGQLPDRSTSDCMLLRLQHDKLVIDAWPSLPRTVSMHAACCDGDSVYVAGGQERNDSTVALRSFWRLRLKQKDRGWQSLPDLPLTGRIAPLLVSCPDGVYLLSGAELTGTPGPPPGRRFLADAYRFDKASGWQAVAALPRAVQGGTAIYWKDWLLVFSGNDGEYAAREYEVRDKHPGFPTDVWSYQPGAKTWKLAGKMPQDLVSTGIAKFGDEFVIPGGEIRPAVRSARVLAGRFKA